MDFYIIVLELLL